MSEPIYEIGIEFRRAVRECHRTGESLPARIRRDASLRETMSQSDRDDVPRVNEALYRENWDFLREFYSWDDLLSESEAKLAKKRPDVVSDLLSLAARFPQNYTPKTTALGVEKWKKPKGMKKKCK